MNKLLPLAIIAATLAFACPASAIEFDTPILEMDGSVPRDDKGQEVNMTVRTVVIRALMQPITGDENELGEEKVKRSVLAERIYKKENYNFSAEEITMIKKRVNKVNPSPLVVRQAWDALEKK